MSKSTERKKSSTKDSPLKSKRTKKRLESLMKDKLELQDLFLTKFETLNKETAVHVFDDLLSRYGNYNTTNFLAIPSPIIMQRMVR